MQTGVIDEPLGIDQDDKLGVQEYADALFQFITDAQTPMTIGIQGDWGSGKTSLMNQMWFKFNNPQLTTLKAKQIWINTWEHSLLKTPQEALVSIISNIIKSLSEDLDTNRQLAIRETASKVLQGAFRIGASLTAGVEGANVLKEFFGDDQHDNSIASLRRSLNELIEEVSARKYDRFVIYIDDLDRLEPANAVEILELLKNIFNIKHCVFLLAIDYNVVVKGLAKKFGTLTKENRWEYDAFFHKIIQLTFQMPISNYDIGNYLSSLLHDTGFVKEGELDQKDLSTLIQETIGGNPRSIKRLVNNIALNKIFISVKDKRNEQTNAPADPKVEKITKFLLVALNCIQIQYPKVYEALTLDPDFTNWDESFANDLSDNSSIIEEKEEVIRELENFKNEYEDASSWEVALFKICYPEPRLRLRFRDICDTLILLQKVIAHHKLPEIMRDVVEQTKVTSTGFSGIAAPTAAYQQMSDLDTKLNQLSELERNPNAIQAISALIKPSVEAAKVHSSIFVSLKPNAAAVYKVDGGKKEQWLYLFNPGKKASGIRFELKTRSGLMQPLSEMFVKRGITSEIVEENKRQEREGTQFLQKLSEQISSEDYLDVMRTFGEMLMQEIIGSEA